MPFSAPLGRSLDRWTATPSELNNEKREGSYHCANCGIKLFNSNSKYESGSGWPSFFESLPEVFETKTDHLIGYARTEYHCKNCGGHHGHIFEDGPQPTGKRYCNNGVCLIFKVKWELLYIDLSSVKF